MLSNLLGSTETLVFTAIAFASFIAVAGSYFFGGGDDHHDMGGGGLDHDHEIPVFSPKIIFSFTLGFGASAAIASSAGVGLVVSILVGIGCGLLMGLVSYGMIAAITKQQANSMIETKGAVGKVANVTNIIPADGTGEVGLEVQGQYQTYLARSRGGHEIAKGARVRVVENQGGTLLVEPEGQG